MNNFVIFAHERSGSTTLYSIFESQSVNIFSEPFNSHSTIEYLYHWGKFGFESAVDLIFQKHQGIKHLSSFATIEQNNYLKSCAKTILLHRENLLDSAISLEMAVETNVWALSQKDTNYCKSKIYLKPSCVSHAFKHLKKHIKYLDDNCLPVTYEELYYGNNQEKLIESMFNFTGCKITDYTKILQLLSIKDNKINDRDWSQIIENWDEIRSLV